MIEPSAPPGESHSQFASALCPGERADIVRTVYQKHATELLAIEEAQQKLTLLLLGVFGAGASFLASEKGPPLSLPARLGLSLVVMGITSVAWRYTKRRDEARTSVRNLLIACERALGLLDEGIFLSSGPLYGQAEVKQFATQGPWLSNTVWIAGLAALGFLLVLWSPYFTPQPPTL